MQNIVDYIQNTNFSETPIMRIYHEPLFVNNKLKLVKFTTNLVPPIKPDPKMKIEYPFLETIDRMYKISFGTGLVNNLKPINTELGKQIALIRADIAYSGLSLETIRGLFFTRLL